MTSAGLASNWPGGTTITINRREAVGTDELGNDIIQVVESVQVQAILVPLQMKLAPRATRTGSFAEALEGQFIVAAGYTCFLPPGTQIDIDDQVIINGESWRLSGRPGNWNSPFTQAAGLVQCELERVTG